MEAYDFRMPDCDLGERDWYNQDIHSQMKYEGLGVRFRRTVKGVRELSNIEDDRVINR